jgi:hypothetical protein
MADVSEQRVTNRSLAIDDGPLAGGYPLSVINLWHDPRLARWAAWGVILLTAVLYVATLDTGLRPDELSGGDLITHQYAQVQGRPSNAPGYPLYTMGGWLWFRLMRPLLGWALNPVQRLASYSTLWALLALFVLYRLILHVTRGNWPLAALSTAFYAVTYFFWYYSVTTEQYTSAVLQTLLIVWLAFRWDEAQARAEGSDHYLLWLAFVVGTCLANLVTTLFILPPLLWFILGRRPDLLRRPGLLARGAGLVLLPVTSYAFVYAQGAVHPEWRGAGQWPSAWAWFVDFLTTQQGRNELAPGLTLAHFFTGEFPALIWSELTWVVLAGGLLGLWWLGRRRAFFLYSTLAIYLLFCWVDRFGNWFQVIMPAYPLLVLGFATGLNALRLEKRPWGIRGLMLIGLVALVSYRFAISLPRADQSYRPEDTGLDPGWAVLADEPLARSVILGDYNQWLALEYLTNIWGAGPPIYPRPLCQPDLPGQADNTRSSPDVSAIYLTRQAAVADPTCLAGQHRYAAGATLIRVQPAPNTQVPESARPAAYQFGPQLTLAGYQVHRPPQGGPERDGRPASYSQGDWHLSLYWRANEAMNVDYTVSVRPLRDGQLIASEDGQPRIQDHQPVWNSYPTSRWSPGEVVRDDYVLSLPSQVTPNSVQIVVYRSTPAGLEDLGKASLALTP